MHVLLIRLQLRAVVVHRYLLTWAGPRTTPPALQASQGGLGHKPSTSHDAAPRPAPAPAFAPAPALAAAPAPALRMTPPAAAAPTPKLPHRSPPLAPPVSPHPAAAQSHSCPPYPNPTVSLLSPLHHPWHLHCRRPCRRLCAAAPLPNLPMRQRASHSSPAPSG